jgi:hypothetical protein
MASTATRTVKGPYDSFFFFGRADWTAITSRPA